VASRAGLVALLALAVGLAGATPAASDPPRSVSSYYFARPDPRLCPSPICGGLWVRLVNKGATTCGDGARQRECYAASADLTPLHVDEKGRVLLGQRIAEGRALTRGKLVRGRIEGFPELDVLVVSEVWEASSSRRAPTGVFRRLRDNGIRCVTSPCFSIRAAALNTGRHVEISSVDLGTTGAPAGERRRALALIGKGHLIAAGRVVIDRNAGPAGDGRRLTASQFYVKVTP
jgi:hypothetical protein